MRKRVLGLMVGAALAGPGFAMDFIDMAPVISVTALYGPVADARECFAPGPQPVVAGQVPPPPPPGAVAPAGAPQAPQDRNVIAPIVGGAAGALLGSQVGSGRGRDAAAAVGAVAGTVITDRVVNPDAPSSNTGALVGGAAGALLGNQVGSGTGRTAATAAGAIGGSMVGDRVMAPPAQQQPPKPAQYPMQGQQMQAQAPVDRCRTVDGVQREVLRGYSVVYRYNGRDITTTVPNHPGNSIRIAIGPLDTYPQQQAMQQPGYPPQGAPAMAPQQPVYPGGVPVMAPQQPMYAPQPGMVQQQPPSAQQQLIQQAPALIAPLLR